MKLSRCGYGLALASAFLLACSDDPLTPGTTPDGGGGDGGGCLTTGAGTLKIDIEGLPVGTSASVIVEGPAGRQTVDASRVLDLSAGRYTLTANKVASPDPIVRKAFTTPGATDGHTCVRNGEQATSTITYTEIASSHKLWTDNGSGGASPLLGFSADVLGASGTPAATVAANAQGSANAAFDQDGNLWAAGNTVGDPPLVRYPASVLGTGGSKAYDVALTSDVLNGGSPRVTSLAFDPSGNLWAGVGYSSKVERFTPEQIAAGGAPVPAVEISDVNDPQALAFDDAGNLWTTSDGKVVMYAAARLNASISGAPDLAIEADTPSPVIGPLPNALGLAFDASKNLWVDYDGVLAKLTPADYSGTGAKTVTPAIQIPVGVGALPKGIAFDESGGLWVAQNAGAFVKFSAAQLTSGGDKNPDVVIKSADVAYAGSMAFYPAPAALPLYSRLP